MGLESRGGSLYFYKKQRLGQRVVSRYFGRGEVAVAMASLDRMDREEIQEAREAERMERDEFEALEAQLRTYSNVVRCLLQANLLIGGWHEHKRQWRRERRGGRSEAYDAGTSPETR